MEDDFTCNIVVHSDNLSLFYQKTIQRTHFHKFQFKKILKYKIAHTFHILF